MRLGILIFYGENGGQAEPAADAVTAALRSRDVDVVVNAPEPEALRTPERPAPTMDAEQENAVVITTFAGAQEAGARLGRADCDGVLFWLGQGANPALAAPAAFSLACPILLCGARQNPAFYDTAGVLADRGISFVRLILPEGDAANTPERVEAWLTRNSKKERQKGTEAAQKLFGKRLIFQSDAAQTVDAAQWFHQFGVLVTRANDGVEAGTDDLVVQNGNGGAELTFFLLRHVCDEGAAVRFLRAGDPLPELDAGEPATLAQIYRRKGRFTCLLALQSAAQGDGLAKVLWGSTLYIAPGDVRVRMKAACAALDIDVQEI